MYKLLTILILSLSTSTLFGGQWSSLIATSGALSIIKIKSNVQTVEQETCCPQVEKYAIMDFTASWCGPCQALKKSFANQDITKYLDSNKNRIGFFVVDTDTDTISTQRWQVTSLPTIIIAKWNTETKAWIEQNRTTGYHSSKELLDFFNNNIK